MPFDLKSYARLGAEARLSELQQEIDSILAAFPDLHASSRRSAGGRIAKAAAQSTTPDGTTTRRRRRKPMTAAQRKAVGLRMKKYWAARRKREAKGA